MNTPLHGLYVEPKGFQRPVLRALFATGAGAVFGLQYWRLAEYGFSVSLTWDASALNMLGYLLMGLAVGATAWRPDWLRGVAFGLTFGFGAALGPAWQGSYWLPYGIAAVVFAMVSGLLIAVMTRAVFP